VRIFSLNTASTRRCTYYDVSTFDVSLSKLFLINKLIKFIWNREELLHQWKKLIVLFAKRVMKITAVIIKEYHC
jgi:uncharacterized ubiquitin-like protein YukD